MGWWPSSTLWWLCVHRVLLLSSTPGIGMGIVNINGAEGDSVSGACTTRGAYLSWPSSLTQSLMYVAEAELNAPTLTLFGKKYFHLHPQADADH